ncbi:MAG: hypothetical protein Q8Q01_05150 [archaeon]|nr:hypothetical protein [archaeon]
MEILEEMLRTFLIGKGDLAGYLPLSYIEEENNSLFRELEENPGFNNWALEEVKAVYNLIIPFVKKEEEVFIKIHSLAMKSGIEIALTDEAYCAAVRETFLTREEFVNHRIGMLDLSNNLITELYEACRNAGPFGDVLAEIYHSIIEQSPGVNIDEHLPKIDSIADRIYGK